jgi:hypothetical protein
MNSSKRILIDISTLNEDILYDSIILLKQAQIRGYGKRDGLIEVIRLLTTILKRVEE